MLSIANLRGTLSGWPAVIGIAAFLVRLAYAIHWWTIAAFLVMSVAAGACNATILRARGRSFATILERVMLAIGLLSAGAAIAFLLAAKPARSRHFFSTLESKASPACSSARSA